MSLKITATQLFDYARQRGIRLQRGAISPKVMCARGCLSHIYFNTFEYAYDSILEHSSGLTSFDLWSLEVGFEGYSNYHMFRDNPYFAEGVKLRHLIQAKPEVEP
jgi:hypothetical protein